MKKHLRVEMKKTLAAMPPQEVNSRSYAACKLLVSLPEFRDAEAVMLYLPIPREVDPSEAALHAWQQQKTVLVPRVDWQHRHMLAVQIRSMDDVVMDGQHAVPQPPTGPVWPVEDIDLIIVPALAYDRKGARLGRGGGFYDRFLAEPGMRATACGLGFSEQVVDCLPTDKNDRPVEILVTDEEVLRFSSDASTARPDRNGP